MEKILDKEELADQMDELVAKFNEDRKVYEKESSIEYFIGVTGKEQEYFTFWRTNHNAVYGNGATYLGNLSMDLETSVRKAMKKMKNNKHPLLIDYAFNKRKDHSIEVMGFGKYKGKTLADVFKENPGYFIWLTKNFDPKSSKDWERMELYTSYKDAAYELITACNEESSKSEHVGEVGTKVSDLSVKVYRIQLKSLLDGQMGDDVKVYLPIKDFKYEWRKMEWNHVTLYLTAEDGEGNKYKFNCPRELLQEMTKDTTINISKAKVMKHTTKLGVKFTSLGFVKV
jgi:uncharacterized protein (DUF3820 family)